MLERVAQYLTNCFASLRPQKPLSLEQVKSLKLVAHRGAHDQNHKENTLKAFEHAHSLGAWGIELDIQWTKDHVPMVHHDAHCGRVFGRPDLVIADSSFDELRAALPEIPKLQEVIENFAGKVHLFIELKHPLKVFQEPILQKLLENLTPQKDYHFLTLSDEVFRSINFVDPEAMVLVATTNTNTMSESAQKNKFGGLCGHFYLISSEIQAEHQQLNQKVGLGFITSKNALRYCGHRGCEWIFTDHLENMIDIIKKSPKSL